LVGLPLVLISGAGLTIINQIVQVICSETEEVHS